MQYEYSIFKHNIQGVLYFNSQQKEENLPFIKALFCSGMLATMLKKASPEVPIYNWLLTKSHCAG